MNLAQFLTIMITVPMHMLLLWQEGRKSRKYFFRRLILVTLTPQPSICGDIGLKRLVVITGLLFRMRAE